MNSKMSFWKKCKLLFGALLMVNTCVSAKLPSGNEIGTPNLPEVITHNGVTYETVTSPHTGRVWLDRNLGASQVCTAWNDTNCFGDSYQWGRNTDGHEIFLSSTSSIKATNVENVGHENFITADERFDGGIADWAAVDATGNNRASLWSKIDGSSICPIGYQVPTLSEFTSETIDLIDEDSVNNKYDAYDSFLKLPSASARNCYDGYGNRDPNAHLPAFFWTTTTYNDWSKYIYFWNDVATTGYTYRAASHSVRCIKHVYQPPTANAGEDQAVTIRTVVTLSASNSNDSDGDIVSYEWKEGDMILSTDEHFTKSDFSEGTHSIILTVTDDKGASASDEVVVTVSPEEDWLIQSLSDTYEVGNDRFFVKEFSIRANRDARGVSPFDEFVNDYNPDNLNVQLSDDKLTLECISEIHKISTEWLSKLGGTSISSYIQKNCKVYGTLNESYTTTLLVDFPGHSFHKTVDINFTISDYFLNNINKEEAFIILNGDLVSHHAVIGFDAGPEDIGAPPTCVHKDKDGNDVFMNVVKLLNNSRYICSSGGNIDKETIDNIAHDNQINVKITFGNKAKIVEVPVYIRNEKKYVAMIEYAEEYKYMQSCGRAATHIRINGEPSFMDINDKNMDINDKKFYLGGDITNSDNDQDNVYISGGIWKLYTEGHEFLINVDCSSLGFTIKRHILYNTDIFEFSVKAESKFDVMVKKSKLQAAFFLEGIKDTIINFNSEDSAFDQTFADTTAGIRGTTFQVSKEANQSVRFNLLEGEIEISSASLEHNITLNNMTSWKSDENIKQEIRKNTLTPIERIYLKDTSINSVDVNQSIGEIAIHTNIDHAVFYLLGKNVQYGYGKHTVLEEVAEGNYILRFLPVSGYVAPADVDIILSNSKLSLTVDAAYKGKSDFGDTYHNDLLWHNANTGAVKVMPMNGMTSEEDISVVTSSNLNLLPKGIGDFTGDGKPDILFHNQNSGNLRIWEMDGTVKGENIQVLGSSNTNLKIAGVGDFDGDGDTDIATFNTNSGALRMWVMNGTTRVDNVLVLTGANVNLVPKGAGDMNNDGIPDIVLRNNNSGAVRVWTMNSDFTRKDNEYVTGSSNTNLELRGVMDINSDGNNDILNYNTNTGKLRAWLMDGNLKIIENAEIVQDLDLDWSVRN